MNSPQRIAIRSLSDAEYVFRKLREDIDSLITSSTETAETAAEAAALRRVRVQSVLPDSYLCSYLDGDLDADLTISYTEVSTLADLHTIVRSNLKGRFRLTADIDATADCLVGGSYYNSGEGWEPIGELLGGEGGNANSAWQGIFDGNGHTITGLKCNRPTKDFQGLFGCVGNGGVVKNLTLEDCDIDGRACLGVLCGGNYGLVYNVHVVNGTVDGDLTADNSGNAGLLLGDNDGVITLCSTSGEVHGLRDVGGLIGDNDKVVSYCSSSADVYGSQIADIGGISGDNKGFREGVPLSEVEPDKGTVYGCFFTGTVQSEDTAPLGLPNQAYPAGDIGGIVGDNRGGRVSNCWSSGTVSGKQLDVGGLVGSNKLGDTEIGETRDSIISNCYCTGDVTPLGSSTDGECGGLVGDNKGGQVYNSYCSNQVLVTAGVNERNNNGDFCGDIETSDASLVGIVSNCYYNSSVATQGWSDGGIPLPENDLTQQVTFEGWDFEDTWSIVEGIGFPTLPDLPTPDVTTTESEFLTVYPIERTGYRPLTGDVRPKIIPGMTLLAVKCSNDILYTPLVIEDLNFPVDRDDITEGAVGKDQLGDINGNNIAGKALDWDENENLDVQVNETYIHVNSENQLSLVDDSIGESKLSKDLESSTIHFNDSDQLSIVDGSVRKNKLGDINGDSILGFGLDWNDTTEVIDVDPSEFNGNGLDVNSSDELVVDTSEITNPTFGNLIIAQDGIRDTSLSPNQLVMSDGSSNLISGYGFQRFTYFI